MAYNPSTKTITAPVSVHDVQQALNITTTTLNGLDQSGYINPWARYKPVVKDKLFTTDEWDFTNNTWKTTASWFRGLNNPDPNANFVGFGFTVPYKTTPNQIINAYHTATDLDNMHGWVYTHPGGTINQPFRLMNFAGYRHDAAPIVGAEGLVFPDKVFKETRVAEATLMMKAGGATDEVNLSDFFENGCHFGVIVSTNPGSGQGEVKYWCVNTNTISSVAQLSVNFPDGVLEQGKTYRVYPFFMRHPTSGNITKSEGTLGTEYFPDKAVTLPVIEDYYKVFAYTASTPSIHLSVIYSAVGSSSQIEVNTRDVNNTGPYTGRLVIERNDTGTLVYTSTTLDITASGNQYTLTDGLGLRSGYTYTATLIVDDLDSQYWPSVQLTVN